MEAQQRPHLTMGEFLQHVREKRGYTVEQVAEELKLKVSTVRALEADQYQDIAGFVYLKGYLKSYARLLHVNIDKHLHLIKDKAGEHFIEVPEEETQLPKKKTTIPIAWGMILLIVLLAMIIAAAYVWHRPTVSPAPEKPSLPVHIAATLPTFTKLTTDPAWQANTLSPAIPTSTPKVTSQDTTTSEDDQAMPEEDNSQDSDDTNNTSDN